MAKRKEGNVEEREVVVYLFDASTSKDLKIDYPELASIEEFKDLQPKELKFCWYVGNRTSPFFEYDRERKIKQTLAVLFPRGFDKFKEWVEVAEGNMPDKILRGIERMTQFNVENRLQAKMLAEYSFYKLQLLMDVDDSVIKTMDFDDRKRYSDVLMSIQKNLGSIVKDLETGYGVKVVDKATNKKVLVSIDNIG
jgi:hypothetical protein